MLSMPLFVKETIDKATYTSKHAWEARWMVSGFILRNYIHSKSDAIRLRSSTFSQKKQKKKRKKKRDHQEFLG